MSIRERLRGLWPFRREVTAMGVDRGSALKESDKGAQDIGSNLRGWSRTGKPHPPYINQVGEPYKSLGIYTRARGRGHEARLGHISGIEWKRSNKQVGGAVEPNDGWAWAFAYTQDGGIRREAAQLVAAFEQYGKVLIDGFEITFGGRDENLLNRKKVR